MDNFNILSSSCYLYGIFLESQHLSPACVLRGSDDLDLCLCWAWDECSGQQEVNGALAWLISHPPAMRRT